MFIFRGIWNPIEASFAMLCYVSVGTRVSITLHACACVAAACPTSSLDVSWLMDSQVSCLQGENLIVVSIPGQPST